MNLGEVFEAWAQDLTSQFGTSSEALKANQLITFEGEEIDLDEGYAWEIHKQVTPNGVKKMPDGWYFEDFDEAHHIKQTGAYHLFRLRTKGIDIIAYCIITKG